MTLYRINLTMFAMPSDTLLGRIHREFERGTMTIMPIRKAVSLYYASLPREQQQLEIGGGVSLQLGKADLPPLKKVAK